MRKLLHEPLLHFIFLGVLIFAGFKFASRNNASQPGSIVVTQGRVESLVTNFTRTWQRPPSPAELDGLIRDYIREEVYAREAMALGLDKDDTIIRRRLRQKLEFISEGVVEQADPTDAQLQEYLQAYPDLFSSERELTFKQVYLDPQRHGENFSRDVAQTLERLRRAGSAADISAVGDSVLMDQSFEELPLSEVSKQFGEKFAAKLGELPVGQWEGPIESGYGVHLVLVTDRRDGRQPTLNEVRDTVRREWANAQRMQINEKFYQALLQRYAISIEQPQLAATDSTEQRRAEVRR